MSTASGSGSPKTSEWRRVMDFIDLKTPAAGIHMAYNMRTTVTLNPELLVRAGSRRCADLADALGVRHV